MPKFNPILIFMLILFIFIWSIFLVSSFNKNTESSCSLNLESNCYTNLQPSNYFQSQNSSIIENHDLGYIKIEIKDEFSTNQVAPTGSMHSCISDFSSLILIKPKIEDIKEGDIISFYCNENHTKMLHRVINISKKNNQTYFLTKGDANQMDDLKTFNCEPNYTEIKWKVVGILY